jgi:hypothetical protein
MYEGLSVLLNNVETLRGAIPVPVMLCVDTSCCPKLLVVCRDGRLIDEDLREKALMYLTIRRKLLIAIAIFFGVICLLGAALFGLAYSLSDILAETKVIGLVIGNCNSNCWLALLLVIGLVIGNCNWACNCSCIW